MNINQEQNNEVLEFKTQRLEQVGKCFKHKVRLKHLFTNK